MNVEVFTPPIGTTANTFSPQSGGFTEVFVAGGPRGVQGNPGTVTFVLGETPGGAVDGVNMDFTTAAEFDSLWVFLNGLRMKAGSDYNLTGPDSFTFTYPPTTGDTLTVDYVPA